jgi:PD-(D/E)XK nuclease superfamily
MKAIRATGLKPMPTLPVAYVSTSDRTSFRNCRRKWNWSSPLRAGLRPLIKVSPLWMGTGGHHALEAFHGYKQYETMKDAIDDYTQATIKAYKECNLPDTYREDRLLLIDMLTYYRDDWLKQQNRSELNTLVVDGVPQVEVDFEFEMPFTTAELRAFGLSKAIYRGTFDRITVDEEKNKWIQDYKFVKAFTNPDTLELDSQIGAYMWAGRMIYGPEIVGFIYNQFRKDRVEEPRVLKNGEISTAKDQSTTARHYYAALQQKYGYDESLWTQAHAECLASLETRDEPDADKYIRRDKVYRGQTNNDTIANIIMREMRDMLNPKTEIYPNPTFLCKGSCAFLEPCLQQDKGESFKLTLASEFQKEYVEDRNSWRDFLEVKPDKVAFAKKHSQPVKPIRAPRGTK